MATKPRQIVPLLLPEEPVGVAGLAPLALPLLSYHNGPVLTAAQVVTIFWGAAWAQPAQSGLIPQLNQFFDFILTSSLLDLMAEYSVPGQTIGHGTRVGTVTITATEPGGGAGQVSDAQIQQALQIWIANGTVPPVTANTLYFVYLPPGVISTLGAIQSCQAFCGYHNQISGNIFYAVEPFLTCAGCTFGNGQAFDSLTKVSSHELCEAITDPALNAWFDDATGNENGDICNSTQQQLGGYTIQLEWSNQSGTCRLQPATLPVVTWSPPLDIVYGTPLGPVQLNAIADEPGSFVYTPPSGAVLNAGLSQVLSVLFTPFNATHQSVAASVQLNVFKATPSIEVTRS